jgi:hypothetical protein
MDTENTSSKGQPPNASSSDKGSKGGSTSAPNKKACEGVSADPDSFSSTSIPEYMASARRNMIEWLGVENFDEERCFNLLRDMELVDEDGYYVYEGEETKNTMEDNEEQLPLGTEAAQPEFAKEQNKIETNNIKKNQN